MINIGYCLLGTAAEKKVGFYKGDRLAYFVSSMLAGVCVGICVITILVMDGMFNGFAGIKILQGVSFAAALSLVVFAGAELFTGNVFVMTAGVLLGKIRRGDAIGLCAFCYLGNMAGSILIAALFLGTGYLQGMVLAAATNAISSKTNPLFWELLIRGILCNMLVCAAVWCVYRMHSESGKLIMIFWCIYLFVVCGFEHSIANMTLFSLGVMARCSPLDLMLVNLAATTIGNILGGMALSFAYWMVGRKAA
jgi:nitrite transporter NirC